MLDVIGSIWWLIVALGILVTFHEYGHYWVARRCGVRVLRFSVGFGSPLWSRYGRDGTEYRVAAIPLGGYVKMLDERETAVAPGERDQAFNNKPVGQRIAIVAAGPIFNLIFALFAFWLMFVVGIPETRPVLGEPRDMAAEAGLQSEDLITRVGDRSVQTWTHALLALIPPALDRRAVELTVQSADGSERRVELPLSRLGADFREDNVLEHIGLQPWRVDLPPLIGEVSADSPAERAGLAGGDRIVSIGDQPVTGWQDIARFIPEAAERDRSFDLVVHRDGRERVFSVSPEMIDGRPIIGIQAPPPGDAEVEAMERAFTILRHGPVSAVGEAFGETWRLTAGTLGILGRMITGKASLSNLSGPITIAQMAHSSARLGLSRFLWFLGLISLSLAIINLLPIPMLDGGHLMYYLAELVKGSPVSEKTQVAGQYVGLLLIVALMSLAIFNDILRLFT